MLTGWHVVGSLPDVDPNVATDDDRGLFTEDLLLMTSHDGMFQIDIGWLPQADLECGQFVAELHAERSDEPLMTFRTRSAEELNAWVTRAAERARSP